MPSAFLCNHHHQVLCLLFSLYWCKMPTGEDAKRKERPEKGMPREEERQEKGMPRERNVKGGSPRERNAKRALRECRVMAARCCSCTGRSAKCIHCACMKYGRPCLSCLPNKSGKCQNMLCMRQKATSASVATAALGDCQLNPLLPQPLCTYSFQLWILGPDAEEETAGSGEGNDLALTTKVLVDKRLPQEGRYSERRGELDLDIGMVLMKDAYGATPIR